MLARDYLVLSEARIDGILPAVYRAFVIAPLATTDYGSTRNNRGNTHVFIPSQPWMPMGLHHGQLLRIHRAGNQVKEGLLDNTGRVVGRGRGGRQRSGHTGDRLGPFADNFAVLKDALVLKENGIVLFLQRVVLG